MSISRPSLHPSAHYDAAGRTSGLGVGTWPRKLQVPNVHLPLSHAPIDTMRWLQLLAATLLPFTALAAKKASTGDRFLDARAKALSTGHPVKLDDPSYAQLTKSPRDYGVAVLLTALETRFGCALCREFQPEWDLLGKSWMKGDRDGQTRLVFGTLDFVDGKNTFQSVRDIPHYLKRDRRLTAGR